MTKPPKTVPNDEHKRLLALYLTIMEIVRDLEHAEQPTPAPEPQPEAQHGTR